MPRGGYSRRRTHEEYKRDLAIANPNIELLSQYVDSHTWVKLRCKIDGYVWESTPSPLLHGRGCRRCAARRLSEKQSKSHSDFVAEMAVAQPGIEVIGQYIAARKKVALRCRVCGHEWKALPDNVVHQKGGCPECGNRKISQKQILTEEFVRTKLMEVNPDVELIGPYKGMLEHTKMRCRKCGYEWEPLLANLYYKRNGHVKGCPKCNRSHGEIAIERYLSSHSIAYEPQKKFDGLVGVGGRLLSYDFFLPDYNTLIEFQGEQHYSAVDYYGGEENFQVQQAHDSLKADYASSHGHRLLTIPYKGLDRIEEILDAFFVAYKAA